MSEKIGCEIRDVGMELDKEKEGDPIVTLKFSPRDEQPMGDIIDFLVDLKNQPTQIQLRDDNHLKVVQLVISLSEAYVEETRKEAN